MEKKFNGKDQRLSYQKKIITLLLVSLNLWETAQELCISIVKEEMISLFYQIISVLILVLSQSLFFHLTQILPKLQAILIYIDS